MSDQGRIITIAIDDLSEIIASAGNGRCRQGDREAATARMFERSGLKDSAEDSLALAKQYAREGDDLLRAAGALTVTKNPEQIIARVMAVLKSPTSDE